MIIPQALRRRAVANEGGAVSTMVAVLGFAIFVSLALVVDGGRQLGALSEAADIADNAARVGSQQVDDLLWRDTGRPVVDQARASQQVQDYLVTYVSANATARVVPSSGPDADTTVTVEVTLVRNRFFFPVTPVVATRSASSLDGVLGP